MITSMPQIPARPLTMARDLGLDDVVDHFTLIGDELDQLRNKSGATRLGFAVLLKFLLWRGRFPRGLHEVPDDAAAHLARQVRVPAAELGSFDFASRTAKRHRTEIRAYTGFRECSVADAEALAGWLAEHVASGERRPERVRDELILRCRAELIEPPTPERVSEIARSALHQAEQALLALIAARLDAVVVARLEALIAVSDDNDDDDNLCALLHLREREVTDALAQLLISTVHRINARSEEKVITELVKDFKRVTGKETLLRKIAEASLGTPDDTVREVIFPVVGGEATLQDLVAEYRQKGTEYQRQKRKVFKASYSNHYRRGLIRLLGVLEFRSNNTAHQPVIDALALIVRYAHSTGQYYPAGEHVIINGAVDPIWADLLTSVDSRKQTRVIRHVYEACVFQALRERLRCKEIWVLGAHEWRNPDEDLPTDFETRRAERYDKLHKPLDPAAFTAALRDEMRGQLAALNDALPDLDWLRITNRKSGAIRLSPVEAQLEPRNLRRLKKAIRDRWGQVPLIDMITEAALRTGMLGQLTAVGPREALARAVLWERLLLLAYAYGTNTGISAVAAGEHGHSEADLRYTARRHFTIDGARAVAIQLANATFAACQRHIWGESTTTVASDSTHFRAYDQNLFTERHSRYGERGVLIYWHIEKKSMAVHSQLISCAASEVAAMIEGAVRHGTTMALEGNYVDSHGQTEIGFAIALLLGFDLLPRIKQINKARLYQPDRGDPDAYPQLKPAMTRPIRWELIEHNYDILVKHATAIMVGTASTEAILRRFTRNASHPVYQAMLELGRVQKTIFIARYLRDRDLQPEIEEGLNLIEAWNRVNGVIFYGKSGEFATNRRDQQELGMLSLHILQAALVYINTLMIQDILAEPEWAGVLTPEDLRGLTPLFWAHVLPHGEVKLNMTRRLALNAAQTVETNAASS
jgi:TnpA family transposase